MKKPAALPVHVPEFGVLTYQIICVVAATAVFLVRYARAHYLVNFVCLVVGLGVAAIGLRIGPILYLGVFSVSILADGWSIYGEDWGDTGHAGDMLLSLLILAFVVGHYRLQSLQHSILPLDPRRRTADARRRWRVERPARSAQLVTVHEVGLLLLGLPIWALAARLVLFVLDREWDMPGIPGDLGRLLLVLWVLIISVLLTATVFAHWRRRQYDVISAQMLLQDMLWKETRGEQRRINRWQSLGKLLGRDNNVERQLRDKIT